jgi:phosphotransferase system HPr-like phosphotransfer protein
MADERRDGRERRQVQRGGRRSTDLRSLTPELRVEAKAYAAEIDRCVEVLSLALEEGDLVSARVAGKTLKRAADALHLLLATGKSMRQP